MTEPVGPAQWTLKPDAEPTLRARRGAQGRGDIIKTMHRALSRGDRAPDPGAFAIHGDDQPSVLGQLADRGLHDELKGSAYVVIDGVDSCALPLRFGSLEATGAAQIGAIVEARPFAGSDGRQRLSLAVRSDLPLEAQVTSSGAARPRPSRARAGDQGPRWVWCGRASALERRTEHLTSEGLARRA